MKKSSFLFVLDHYHPYIGGAETLFANLAEVLARHGHPVTVITARLPDTAVSETHNSVEIIRVNTPAWGRRYWFSLLAIPVVLRQARGADLIHTATYNAALAAWLAACLLGKPVVLTVHEVFADQWFKLPGVSLLRACGYRLFEKLILSLPFSHYLCVSEFTRARLQRHVRVKDSDCSVSYPAVDYAHWDSRRHDATARRAELGLSADTFVYCYFGRPGVSKGLEILLDAALAVRDAVSSSQLILILTPDPPDRYEALLKSIERLGLSSHVLILDPVPYALLPSYILSADCVVVPSLSEGFGYSALEAASLGRHVIATAGHAVEEILPRHATFVPPRSPIALAEALIAAARVRGPCPPAPPRYDLETHVTQVLALYRRLLGDADHGNRGGSCTSL